MCGIFGMFGGAISPDAASEATRLLHHRGPDDAGVVRVDGGVLVNRRLAIVDLSPAGHQPMASADGTTWVTYNGEVYNYVELRRELESSYRFRTGSDTEVLLAAYERWGDGCLPRLRGMFAFGLWDGRRRRLLCATDRLSIKPLMYHLHEGRLIFSSEVKPIAAAGVRLRPNRRMLYEYLRFGLLDHTDETLFEGIRQLRPGTYLVLEGGGALVRRYWDLTDTGDDRWDGDRSLDEIEAALQESVDIHLRGDVEPALSLSSGLDSNVLRALVQRGGHAPRLHCFTHCFSGTPYDECRRVEPALAGVNVTFHPTEVPVAGLLDRLQTLIGVMEEPVGGLGVYAYWINSRAAADQGFKVLLDGQGADEGFAGYRYYYSARLAALEASGAHESLLEELDAFNRVHDTEIRYGTGQFRKLVAQGGTVPIVQAPDGTALASDYLGRDFERTYAHQPEPLPSSFTDPVKAAMYRDLMFLKIPKLLRFQDRAAMDWSVEVRVPYLDHLLLEKLYGVPSGVLLSGGLTKALLRRIAASRLSRSSARGSGPSGREAGTGTANTAALDGGPKLYVSAPQREWMKSDLRAGCRALIEESAFAADGYVDRGALLEQYEHYCASSDLGSSFFIWKFVNLEFWYRTFIMGRVPGGAPLRAPSHA